MSLKIRIISTLLWNGQTLVKGKGFAADRPVGHPLQAINVFQLREVDEIIFLDVTATKEGRRPDFALVKSLARECFVPLTVGGGVRSVEDVRDLLRAGADKVSVRAAWTPDFTNEVAGRFGRQAIVGCYDHRGQGIVWNDGSIGEVLVQSVSNDGTMTGYNLELIRSFGDMPPLANASGTSLVPVIASGGCGTYEHMTEAIDAGASAVAAGAMWLFTEQTPLEAKKYLAYRGYPVRL